MISFKLTADAEFYAEDINDALCRLSVYLRAVADADDGDVRPIFHKGAIELTKIQTTQGDE